ncbi:MAG: NAD-dependent epimerase/dehydratase family protein [Proteobacteria bacterium]|nr:NAD-dependent epimerase/dehydratase family protein [Pseudomonadota bacterium]MBU1389058.1 NAD-dependent epimerase/dehydratase family protein [Pseudomonadota bacterium]MBU1543610.1 NAD-dependent epimerase/dehydratase family protein [Pseudomonadota bacterium]MBU2481961.1 NAD-dependent epimerase/dehydratase family protein [Pseudomonadota bacterium]
MSKTAIVIGATGLVGRALVDQLADADHVSRIITLTRRPVKHSSSKIINQVVDFDHLEEYASFFKADILFSCLGTTLKQAGSIAAQRKVDLEYQFRAAQLAAGNGVQHYLLVSSSAASHKSKNPYLKMKGELEHKIQSLPFKHISIFQPSLLLGQRPDFRFAETLGSLLLPVLYIIPWLRRFRPIAGRQVAAKMVLVSRQPGSSIEWLRLDEIFINDTATVKKEY